MRSRTSSDDGLLLRTSSDHARGSQFYVNLHRENNTVLHVASKAADFPLLKGEIISAECEKVSFFPCFRAIRPGKLCFTNFRVCFVPEAIKLREPCCSRSLLLSDDFHFSLCSIEAIYIASLPSRKRSLPVPKKFRLMTAPASHRDIISFIKVFTKDFRVWIFDLQESQLAVNLANSIYHFSRPASLHNFFHVPCKNRRAPLPSRLAHTSIAFNNENDWLKELARCKANGALWRICCLDADKKLGHLVPSYPSYVVVLRELDDRSIHAEAKNWTNSRFPVWCWSAPNGSALLRSSKYCGESKDCELSKEILGLLSQPHHIISRTVYIDIPVTRISSSFEKLRELCSVENAVQFSEREKEWYSLLDATGWFSLVFDCLSLTKSILNKMMGQQRSVIITDDEGFDSATIVSSLVQICADRYYRTINGLNKLIEKEWIALGHPFGLNIFRCTTSSRLEVSGPCTATFLVFLDCLYQLLRLYPVSFEYSQYMLIALWDLCIMGIAPALVCNSVSDQISLERNISVFPLSQYYSSKYCIMFTNVVYSANCLLGIGGLPTVLQPPANPFDIEFWTDCYLRWVSPANIQKGGDITRDLALSSILANVPSLISPCEPVVWRQRLHPAFDFENICSAFPYSEATEADFARKDTDSLSRASSFKSLRIDLNSTYPVFSRTDQSDSGIVCSRPSPAIAGSVFSRPSLASKSEGPQNSIRTFSPSSGTLV